VRDETALVMTIRDLIQNQTWTDWILNQRTLALVWWF